MNLLKLDNLPRNLRPLARRFSESHRLLAPTLGIVVALTGCAKLDSAWPPSSLSRTSASRASLSLATPGTPAKRTNRWAEHSRAGRAALQPDRYREAEYHFTRALESLDSVSKRDARITATLGNLVQLAAILERLESREDAKRVMAVVMEYADSRGMSQYRSLRYDNRYRDLVAQPLGRIYRPLVDEEDLTPAELNELIARTARRFEIDAALVKAVVAAESNFKPNAVSHAGAQGLMQLMPATAREMGVSKPFKPSENLKGGVRYLRKMLDRYGDTPLALAAYNAGPHAVDRHGGIPPYPETQQYVQRVLDFYQGYSASATP